MSVSIKWQGDDVLALANKASGEALQKGARIITAQANRNVRKHKINRQGGYGRKPGFVAKQIEPGPTKANGKPVGSVMLHFPAFQVEYGVKHYRTGKKTTPLRFLWNAVEQKKNAILQALKGL